MNTQNYIKSKMAHTSSMETLLMKHKVDLSFLKYGFVISQEDLSREEQLIKEACTHKRNISIKFEGEEHTAIIDNPRKNLYRLMFKSETKKMFQKAFSDCYDIVTKDTGEEDIEVKAGKIETVAFYKTDIDYKWEARRMKDDTPTAEEMRKAYKAFLNDQKGAYNGYVNAIDVEFIKELVKKEYGVNSAYSIFEPDIIMTLVDKIRDDSKMNELDKKSNNRRPSCSLKKYAEFLKVFNKSTAHETFNVKTVIDTISATGLIFDPKFVQRYLCSLLTKPFVILSGLTGSGKTQLAMAFPRLICMDKSQYKLIPVGADWTNREQLLGYPNALRSGEYVMPDNGALQLILEASKPENQDKPYFLILDEMNMSYVERYFADFLSAMESGEEIPLWEGNKDIPPTITLPRNLFIVGTINVDETTYMFSPKVLDRANVIEFRINKEQLLEYLNGTGEIGQIENLSELAADFVASASDDYTSSLSEETTETIINMFETLSKIQKEFGFRTAHEMSRFIAICKKFTDMSDEEMIDAAIVQKLLPKIHGSRKKISPILSALWLLCYNEDAVEIDTMDAMPEMSSLKYPLTAEKIWRMYQIAQDNGFTSFAEA